MIHINKLLLFFVFLSITTAEAQKTTLPISILKGHTDLITSLEFSSDGRILASLSDDGTTNLWNISDRSLIKTFSRVSLHMALSPDGKTLATDPSEYKQADLDKGIFNPTQTITFWSVNDGSLIRKLEIDKTIYSMTFSPDGSILAGAIGDGTVKLWNVKNGGLIRTINTGDDLELSVAFSPDGKILASGGIGKEKIVRLWKVDDGALIRILDTYPGYPQEIHFNKDGRLIAARSSGSPDTSEIKVWNVSDGRWLVTFYTFDGGIRKALDFGSATEMVRFGMQDNWIFIFETYGERELLQWIVSPNPLYSLALSPVGNLLAAGDKEGNIYLWEVDGNNSDIENGLPKAKLANKNSIAVIIGNKGYIKKDVPKVDYAVNDARLIKEYLINSFGYSPDNILYYENTTQSDLLSLFGTKDNYKGKLYNYVKAGKSDVFVYYSGHGAPDPESKQGYFVPVDCDPQMVSLTGYSLNTFYKNLSEIDYKSLTVVVDACFSGTSDKGTLLRNISPVFITVDNPVIKKENTNVFTSTGGDQVSSWYPEKKHSLFTYYFLKGIKGDADANKDKVLTVGELQSYLLDNVPYMARRLNNREQTPQLIGDNKNEILIRY